MLKGASVEAQLQLCQLRQHRGRGHPAAGEPGLPQARVVHKAAQRGEREIAHHGRRAAVGLEGVQVGRPRAQRHGPGAPLAEARVEARQVRQLEGRPAARVAEVVAREAQLPQRGARGGERRQVVAAQSGVRVVEVQDLQGCQPRQRRAGALPHGRHQLRRPIHFDRQPLQGAGAAQERAESVWADAVDAQVAQAGQRGEHL
ncbi:MAG: hypothetical protein J3K34DRAFT_400152 [Monoraphidium minutum]|nr:MAG: hypothetical protein J3K34DRAFT_400152 [Monoraphidium minutum]